MPFAPNNDRSGDREREREVEGHGESWKGALSFIPVYILNNNTDSTVNNTLVSRIE